MSEITVTIERIGAHGDGVATHRGKPVFVPYAAPGDVVSARLERGGHAMIVDWLARGPRREPPCPHFGDCGGCALQHLPDAIYRHAKEELVREALARRGLGATEIAPLRVVAAASRRRARLVIARTKDGSTQIGFHRRASNRIVDMRTCLVLHPKLLILVPPLRELGAATMAPGEDWTAIATLTDTGADLTLELTRPPDLGTLEAFAKFAETYDLARMSWKSADEAPTPVMQRRPVRVAFSGVMVDLPSDVFLQASGEAETILKDLVVAGIGDAGTIADLFSGVGTFSFAFTAKARVHAVDGEKSAIAALRRAADRAGLGASLATECRDLEQNPLRADELDRFDAVIFDPPYAGARAQSREIAASKVKRVVAVSCNPASFARDARILIDGGFRLSRVTPIDQFVWSAEIELVAGFER